MKRCRIDNPYSSRIAEALEVELTGEAAGYPAALGRCSYLGENGTKETQRKLRALYTWIYASKA